jgi:hypothetical protein
VGEGETLGEGVAEGFALVEEVLVVVSPKQMKKKHHRRSSEWRGASVGAMARTRALATKWSLAATNATRRAKAWSRKRRMARAPGMC